MGEPIKECWDRRQYHTGLAHIKRNRRTQFGILGAAIKPKWDGPTYPKGMTQLTNVAGPTLVKPAGPLQVSGLKILTSSIQVGREFNNVCTRIFLENVEVRRVPPLVSRVGTDLRHLTSPCHSVCQL